MCFGSSKPKKTRYYYHEEIIPVRQHHHHSHRAPATRSSYSRHTAYAHSPRASVVSYRSSGPVMHEKSSRTRY